MTGLNTVLVHADDHLSRVSDIVQPINTATTFAYDDDPEKLVVAKERSSDSISTDDPYYSRLSHPNSTKVEEVLSKVLGGEAVAYNSGLSAFYAALTYLNPKQLCIGKGYHGCHGIANIITRNYGMNQLSLAEEDIDKLGPGDLLHLETPVNPEGTSFDIKHYADKAHSKGAKIMIDATFAPPPLCCDLFEKYGIDMVMYSLTKYAGGHSDLLAGALVTKDPAVKSALVIDRIYLGTNIANLESYLLLRSLRTYKLRIMKQSENATALVKYLNENKKKFPILDEVFHSSLQTESFIKEQLPGGFPPTFSITLKTSKAARYLPSKLKFFHHATSLGGVESLIEWRAMSDDEVSETLLRVSCGVEDVEDLISDFDAALTALSE